MILKEGTPTRKRRKVLKAASAPELLSRFSGSTISKQDVSHNKRRKVEEEPVSSKVLKPLENKVFFLDLKVSGKEIKAQIEKEIVYFGGVSLYSEKLALKCHNLINNIFKACGVIE